MTTSSIAFSAAWADVAIARVAGVVAIVAIAALSGCTPSGGGREAEGTPVQAGGLDWVQYTATGSGGDAAEASGTIVDVDGCLGVDDDDDDSTEGILLAFSADDARPRTLKEGDHFTGTGGYVSATSADDLEIPDSCAGAETVFIVAVEG